MQPATWASSFVRDAPALALKHHAPWVPSTGDRAVAEVLGPGAAFLPVDDGLVWVRSSGEPGGSAVLALAQAVYERWPERAFTVLRRRIRTTDPVTTLDRAVADVAAKRVSWVEGAPGAVPRLTELSEAVAAARARGRAALLDPQAPLALHGHQGLVAALVDPTGRVVMAARNAAASNRTLHAETNLVQAWVASTGRGLPAGWRLLASLQPCRMCAALVVAAAEGPIRVEYVAPDPGPLATRTALQALGWEHPFDPELR